jgi:DNA repair exonuclease SbcCD ATPase subunit
MMKKIITLLLTGAIVFSLVGSVHAQDADLPSPGVTPDSPLYFLDTLGEKLSLAFSRGEGRARKALEIAEEKLAEAEAMTDEGNEEAAETAVNRYGETISEAASVLAQAAQSGEGFDEALSSLIAQATSIHLDVLSRVYERVPVQAQEAIQRAMEKSSQAGERALGSIDREETRTQAQEQVQERLQETEQRLEQLREEGKPIPTLPSFGKPEDGENETGQGGGGQQQGGSASVQVPAGGRP